METVHYQKNNQSSQRRWQKSHAPDDGASMSGSPRPFESSLSGIPGQKMDAPGLLPELIPTPVCEGGYLGSGLPVIKERCLQTMIVNALEPEWESQFETSSYGFRPGRSCHDAIERIYRYARPNSVKQWVIDADIKGAFDNIDHNFLLERIGNFPGKALIKQWLKAGYMEGNVFFSTEKGTPQGGCCSPLLANIALHGMEEVIGMKYNREGTRTYGERKVVRYADDFVVFCATEQDAQQTIVLLQQWLKERGLELSQEKTRIRHLTEGFDFLGFNICMYPTRNSRTGFKTLIKP